MLRKASVLYSSIQIGFSSHQTLFPNEQRGRFNLSAAASELGLDEAYASSLYKPLHYTYAVKGQRYPAQYVKSSRPGSVGGSSRSIFPLYQRNYRLNRERRELDYRRITTE